MSAFFKSGVIAPLAMGALVAVANAGERAATSGYPGLTESHHATSIAGAPGKSRSGVARSAACVADRERASIAGSRDARIARTDLENSTSVDASPADADGSEREGIVPAIYTWKPETRFVFYRNVGKWM